MEIGKIGRCVLATAAADVFAGSLLGIAAQKVSTVSGPLFGSMAAGSVFLMSLSLAGAVCKLAGQSFLPENWVGNSVTETIVNGLEERSDARALARCLLVSFQLTFEGLVTWKIMKTVWPKFGFLAFPAVNARMSLIEISLIKRELLKLLVAAGAAALVSYCLKKPCFLRLINKI